MLAYVSHSVSARGKVADHQIERGHPELLGFGHRWQGLVGGEDDGQAFGAFAVRHLGGKGRGVGCHGDGDVVDVDVFGGPGHLGI